MANFADNRIKICKQTAKTDNICAMNPIPNLVQIHIHFVTFINTFFLYLPSDQILAKLQKCQHLTWTTFHNLCCFWWVTHCILPLTCIQTAFFKFIVTNIEDGFINICDQCTQSLISQSIYQNKRFMHYTDQTSMLVIKIIFYRKIVGLFNQDWKFVKPWKITYQVQRSADSRRRQACPVCIHIYQTACPSLHSPSCQLLLSYNAYLILHYQINPQTLCCCLFTIFQRQTVHYNDSSNSNEKQWPFNSQCTNH